MGPGLPAHSKLLQTASYNNWYGHGPYRQNNREDREFPIGVHSSQLYQSRYMSGYLPQSLLLATTPDVNLVMGISLFPNRLKKKAAFGHSF